MVRSAAKNWADVGVLTDASQYPAVLAELQANGKLSRQDCALHFRWPHSTASRNTTARSVTTCRPWRSGKTSCPRPMCRPARCFPASPTASSSRCRICATAKTPTSRPLCTATCTRRRARWSPAMQLQGKELSYNNIADADAAWECVKRFRCAGLRHRQACQPLRRGRGPGCAGVLQQGVPDRSHQCLWRHHCASTARGWRGGPAGQQAVRRGADGAGLHARSAGRVQGQGQRAHPADRRCRAGGATAWEQGRNAMDIKRMGSGLLLQTADNHELALRRSEGGDEGAAQRRSNCRTCCSPGTWPSTSRPMPSSSARMA